MGILLTVFLWLRFQDATGCVEPGGDKYGGKEGNQPGNHDELRGDTFSLAEFPLKGVMPIGRNDVGRCLILDVGHGWKLVGAA